MDRKALIREYREHRPTIGIFQVRNLASGKVFIGATTEVSSMLNRQRAQLRLGMHPNTGLQADWNQSGEHSFAFEVLHALTPRDDPGYDPRDELQVLVALWLDKLAPFDDRGYNQRPRQASQG